MKKTHAIAIFTALNITSCKPLSPADHQKSTPMLAGGTIEGADKLVPGVVKIVIHTWLGTAIDLGGGTFLAQRKLVTAAHLFCHGDTLLGQVLPIRSITISGAAHTPSQTFDFKKPDVVIYPPYLKAIGRVGNPVARMYNEDIAVINLPFDVDARDIMAVADHGPEAGDQIMMSGSSTDQIDLNGQSPVDFTEPKRTGFNTVDGLEGDLNIVTKSPLPPSCTSTCSVSGDSGSGVFTKDAKWIGAVVAGGVIDGVNGHPGMESIISNIHADPNGVGRWLVSQGIDFVPLGYTGKKPNIPGGILSSSAADDLLGDTPDAKGGIDGDAGASAPGGLKGSAGDAGKAR